MTRFPSISALADEVLRTVVEEARTKTASVAADPLAHYTVPTARELRKLADVLREEPDESDVMPQDLSALEDDAEVEQLLQMLQENPELLAALMQEEGLDVPEMYGAPPDMPPDMPPGMGEEEGPGAPFPPGGADGGDMPPAGPPGPPPGKDPGGFPGGGGGFPGADPGGPPKPKKKPGGDSDKDDDDDDGDKPPKKKEKDDKNEDKCASAAPDLRQLAARLRQDSKQQKIARLVKAATVLNAATGIQHLVGSRK